MRNPHDKIVPIGDPPPSVLQRFYWALGRCKKCGGEFKMQVYGRHKRYIVCGCCGYRCLFK